MSKTKLVKIYICDFCGEETEDKLHEKTCKKNPANKHCSTCDNLKYYPMDRDRDGEIIDAHYFCHQKGKTIRNPGNHYDTVSNCDKHVYKNKKDKLKEKIRKLEEELSQAKQDYIREFGMIEIRE